MIGPGTDLREIRPVHPCCPFPFRISWVGRSPCPNFCSSWSVPCTPPISSQSSEVPRLLRLRLQDVSKWEPNLPEGRQSTAACSPEHSRAPAPGHAGSGHLTLL